MQNISNFLIQNKTYLVAFSMVVYALLAVYFHQITPDQALQWFLGAGGLASVTHDIKN